LLISARASRRPFPPYPGPVTAGFIDVWNPETVPCNYLQSYENTLDEVHVAMVHRPGGSHAKIFDLPIITAAQTDWGMIRDGTCQTGKVRVIAHGKAWMPALAEMVATLGF
jgi:hypothetical protein